jgi:hypothetical protein
MDSTCVLATLGSDCADERIQVVLERRGEGASIVSLVQQSWSESLGWYTQQAMELTTEQVGQLRAALGLSAAGKAGNYRSPDRAVPVCVPFPSPTRRAHSA